MKTKTKIITSASSDLKKFYNKLYLYKSFLFCNVNFTLQNKLDEDIDIIIEALNIKNKKERIEFIYDYVCNTIDKRYENKDICEFKDSKCLLQRVNKDNKSNGCCRLCLYQSNKGCTTKNMTCKFFYCSEIHKRYDMYKFDDFKILKCLSLRQRILLRHNFFSNREDVLKDLYIGSLIIGTIRMVYRLLRNSIALKKN